MSRKIFTTSLEECVIKAVQEVSKSTMIPQARLIEKAIKDMLEKDYGRTIDAEHRPNITTDMSK